MLLKIGHYHDLIQWLYYLSTCQLLWPYLHSLSITSL